MLVYELQKGDKVLVLPDSNRHGIYTDDYELLTTTGGVIKYLQEDEALGVSALCRDSVWWFAPEDLKKMPNELPSNWV